MIPGDLIRETVQHLQQQFLFGDVEKIPRHCPHRVGFLPEFLELEADPCEAVHIFLQKITLLHGQVKDNGRADHLRGKLPGFHALQGFLVKHPLMGGMLVDDIHPVLLLNDPVCVKHLAHQLIIRPVLPFQKIPFEKLHLPGLFYRIRSWLLLWII